VLTDPENKKVDKHLSYGSDRSGDCALVPKKILKKVYVGASVFFE
jgi:hypothetical protein